MLYTKYPIGIAKRNPSNLSKKPPCPGKILLESFILTFLFKYEIVKSPNCEKVEITKVDIIKSNNSKYSLKNIVVVNNDKTYEPINPE